MTRKHRKGISALISVIMLIAFTLIVAGILATWVTQLAQQQRIGIEQCMGASIIIRGAAYSGTTLQLYVDNTGDVPLNFTSILLKWQNGSFYKNSNPGRYIAANGFETFSLTGLANTIDQVQVQSDQCAGAIDFIQRRYIQGLA